MTNEEKMLREKLGITDPLQVLPVGGSTIPTEGLQASFMNKISDDFLAAAINDSNLTKTKMNEINPNTLIMNKSSDVPPVDVSLPKINEPLKNTVRQKVDTQKNDNTTFSQRFKDAQKRIQLQETHRIIPAHNPLIKLK